MEAPTTPGNVCGWGLSMHDNMRDPRAAVAMDYSRPRHSRMALRLTVPTRAANSGGPGGHPAPLAWRFHRNPIHFPLNLLTIYWKKMVMVAERLSIAPAVPVSRGLARPRPPRPTAPAGFGARWPSWPSSPPAMACNELQPAAPQSHGAVAHRADQGC